MQQKHKLFNVSRLKRRRESCLECDDLCVVDGESLACGIVLRSIGRDDRAMPLPDGDGRLAFLTENKLSILEKKSVLATCPDETHRTMMKLLEL